MYADGNTGGLTVTELSAALQDHLVRQWVRNITPQKRCDWRKVYTVIVLALCFAFCGVSLGYALTVIYRALLLWRSVNG